MPGFGTSSSQSRTRIQPKTSAIEAAANLVHRRRQQRPSVDALTGSGVDAACSSDGMGRDAHGSDDLSTAVASRLGCEEIVRFLHATRRLRGLAFVERATEVLARELGVGVVFVGRLLDGGQAVRSVVVVDGGERADDFV